jgi:hypothetical protein
VAGAAVAGSSRAGSSRAGSSRAGSSRVGSPRAFAGRRSSQTALSSASDSPGEPWPSLVRRGSAVFMPRKPRRAPLSTKVRTALSTERVVNLTSFLVLPPPASQASTCSTSALGYAGTPALSISSRMSAGTEHQGVRAIHAAS